jgi:ATP synthase protein I
MFTTVDSNRKKLEHPSKENGQIPQSQNNSIIKESKSGIANQIDNLLSQDDEYLKLQLTIFGITFIASILLASITGIFLGFNFGFSIFIGAIAGIFYLRLLAKSIGKLGKESSGVSKLQLLVPVCLFIFASKLGSLDIFPAMIGFFIYKPSLILYFSRS